MTYHFYCIVLLLSIKTVKVNSNILSSVNNSETDVSIQLENECIFTIINNHFDFGSTTVIITSGLQNYSSLHAYKFAPDVTMGMMMETNNLRLSIYVKQALNFKHSEVLNVKNINFLFKDT